MSRRRDFRPESSAAQIITRWLGEMTRAKRLPSKGEMHRLNRIIVALTLNGRIKSLREIQPALNKLREVLHDGNGLDPWHLEINDGRVSGVLYLLDSYNYTIDMALTLSALGELHADQEILDEIITEQLTRG